MDPLVRATLAVQKGLSRAWGTTQSALLGAYVVYAAVAEPPAIWNYVAFGALVLALSVRLVRRLYRLMPEASVRVDLELFTTLTVAGYAAVSCAPGGLSGPLYPVLYATMMLAASFSRPAAAIGTLLFALAMEAALTYALGGSSTVLVFHAVLLLLFTVLNLLVFRAEIARVRRLSRARIESEIQRMKEAARSYRLLTAPRSATERNSMGTSQRRPARMTEEGSETTRPSTEAIARFADATIVRPR